MNYKKKRKKLKKLLKQGLSYSGTYDKDKITISNHILENEKGLQVSIEYDNKEIFCSRPVVGDVVDKRFCLAYHDLLMKMITTATAYGINSLNNIPVWERKK